MFNFAERRHLSLPISALIIIPGVIAMYSTLTHGSPALEH